jgi:hypothetical protein
MRPQLRRLLPQLYALGLAALLGLHYFQPATVPWTT